MIDSDLAIMVLVSATLAFLAISLTYFFREGVRIKVLDWMAALLALIGSAFLSRWYIGFSRPAGDLWEAACLLVAMMFGVAALCIWIWRLVKESRGP